MSPNDLDDQLIGLRVQIAIEEDGSSIPPKLPAGTIVRRIRDKDGKRVYVVRLGHPVESTRIETGGDGV